MELNDLYSIVRNSEGIATDSRTVRPGQVFFALKGPAHDGNTHAEAAVRAGATAAVVDDPALKGEKFILVDDVLVTLSLLATRHRRGLTVPVIAVTGSNGKTTTKELITAVLSKKKRVHSTTGNFNNHIGVPLTLLSSPHDMGFMVVEMGANHKGEIAGLCQIAMPTHGIITNIGRAHIEGFGSFEDVKAAKSELYRWLGGSGGTALYNDQNSILKELVSATVQNAVPYSRPAGSRLKVEVAQTESMFLALKAVYEKHDYVFSTNLFGSYNIDNVWAAIATGLCFGVPVSDITDAVSSYKPVNNRSQVADTGRNVLICDSYNANPSSMEMAISSFAALKAERKMVVLGDMLELGSESQSGHAAVIAQLRNLGNAEIVLIGPRFREVAGDIRARLFGSSDEMREWLAANSPEGYTILVKGSRGMALEKIYPLL
jgi:UDP-N-acetylmuramoyl-tripeptide--D-alanyl-D-alanine ligase